MGGEQQHHYIYSSGLQTAEAAWRIWLPSPILHWLNFTIGIFEPAENLFMLVVFDSETGNLSQSFGLKIVNTMMLPCATEQY